ncbi:MAG: endonuclease/exonuclease/phosphatase family protein [Brevibacterium aurantiacum]|uniref:Endonuclease n=1 Tax=Brevibacterium aurantiacum TaxID=273384 RepID=A0A2A3YRF6_BREAU|nr:MULTISPECIES: endonuclease/exonuclease/phosphatase family protein [Brevibacterium]MDN5594775.1 endonuclease/exonuclease/phosphatase family protein [Brevibacterium sp.]AZT92436.1 endonuclease [Brevibacterium aurantiacum]MDN5609332.1 endonuclease/exonuclease/phosphatase family protein [Brevibacterium sp.]MDN5661677.1 endonuclease/exonuclease/phosphatase family protein [Brevibacterium aurantiacum]MDN5736851.1 endonuclease/exonuclease/phosphatase family protein [Brevibacterium aurantiacum]
MNQEYPHPRKTHSPAKGITALIFGVAYAAFLLLHHLLPARMGIALLIESILPWTGVFLALVLLMFLIRFSVLSAIGFLVPTVVWASMFGSAVIPAGDSGGADLTVATHNVGARLPEPTAAAQSLVDADPDIVTIQELESLSGKIIHKELDSSFEHSRVVDTIGVWSKWPMSEPEEVDLGLQWPRAFATTVSTDHGDIRFYSVHMPSVRPGHEAMRNAAIRRLATEVETDEAEHVIVAGDFNTATTDTNFSTLSPPLEDTRVEAGGGFGFTWPARFPVTRLDHVLYRGFDATSDEVLDRGSSDHRAVVAGLDLK